MDKIDATNLRVIHEEFNEYVLSDGNTLRAKDVLISFFTGEPTKVEDNKFQVKVGIQFQPVGGVIPTGKVDISKLEPAKGYQPTDKDRISKLDFTTKKISICIYETDELLILVRSNLVEVWTTKFKDNNDVPMYRFSTAPIMDILNKNEIGKPRSDSPSIKVS